MTTKEIRKAAEAILATVTKDITPHGIEYNNDVENQRYGLKEPYELARFALEQTTGDGEEAITVDWLTNEYGFAKIPKGHPCNYQPYQLGLTVMIDQEDYGWESVHDTDRVPWILFTRHQFRQLAQALNLTPKRKEAE